MTIKEPITSQDILDAFLATNGPALSSEIANHLVKTGFSPANARKIIQRSGSAVARLSNIRFAHNEQFLYLKKQYNKAIFWESLIGAFRATKSVYGLAVDSLIARDGAWPVYYFDIISGSPENLSKHISSSTVLKRLLEIRLIEIVEYPDLGGLARISSAAIPQLSKVIGKSLRSRLIAEDILLFGLQDWLRKTGIGSWKQVKVRVPGTKPKFGQFRWDFSAPSFVYPMRILHRSSARNINGFVIGDVLLGRVVEEKDLEYFFTKADMMRSQPKTRPFLAIFVAERFETTALKKGRNKGLLLLTTETIFGNEVASGLSELIQVLNNAAAKIDSNPAVVPELFKKLDGLKGASLNTRGWLFELLTAYLLKADGWHIISVGELRKDPSTGELAEVDVLAARGTSVVAVECKGYFTNEVTKEEVEKWLTKSVPRIRSSLLSEQSYQSKEIEFTFWTSSKFSTDAVAYLEARKKEILKYRIAWKAGLEIMKYAKETGNGYASRILLEQYGL